MQYLDNNPNGLYNTIRPGRRELSQAILAQTRSDLEPLMPIIAGACEGTFSSLSL